MKRRLSEGDARKALAMSCRRQLELQMALTDDSAPLYREFAVELGFWKRLPPGRCESDRPSEIQVEVVGWQETIGVEQLGRRCITEVLRACRPWLA